ncbi:MAG: heme-binding domain-containing protein [candidate division KSB1 bacterium]|nr:heme-binding domain-containing protein [candidate division KSB1 bacterium]
MDKRKLIVLILVLIAEVIQFFGPARTNPPIDDSKTIMADLQVPVEVMQILERSCFDCHSYATKWPWYSYIAPVSWLVVNDVNEGRRHLNFSAWTDYETKKKVKALDELCEEVEEGGMPLKPYLWMHSDARLSEQDVQTLCDWTKSAIATLRGTTPTNDEDEDEHEKDEYDY